MRLPSALAVGTGILLSRLTGLLRERVIAHFLGNSAAAGVFRAALRIPNLLQTLFGEGVLSASFIPVYSRLLAEKEAAKARALAGAVLPFLLLVVTVIVALGVTFADDCVELIAPGFTNETRAMTVHLVRIMFPGTGLLVLSAWCLGILNSHRRFFVSYAAGVLWNAAIILALLFGNASGSSTLVVWAAWGTVAGAALQFLVQLPQAIKLNGGLKLNVAWRDQAMRQVASNFGPALIARGVVQLSAYIDQVLSSYLGPVIVSGLFYAQSLYLLPVSLFGMAVSASELPEMSSATGSADAVAAAIKQRLAGALARVTFFIVPSTVVFIGMGDTVAATLLQTGQFQQSDSHLVWGMLAALGLGLLASVWSRLLVSAFWAMKDTRTPMRIAILRVILTGALGLAAVFPARTLFNLTPTQAAAGLNATMSLAAWVEFCLERMVLGRRLGSLPPLMGHTLHCGALALVALAIAYGVRVLAATLGPFASGCLVLASFGLVYLGLALATGVPAAREGLERLRRRLRPAP